MLYISYTVSVILYLLSSIVPLLFKWLLPFIVYGALVGFGFFNMLPAFVQFLAFLAAVVVATWVALKDKRFMRVAVPSRSFFLRQIEKQNGLEKGVLSFGKKKPAAPLNPYQKQLWQAYFSKKNQKFSYFLKPAPFTVHRVYAYGWPYALLMVLVVASYVGKGVFNPLPRLFSVDDIYQIQLAYTPPEYTQVAEGYLKEDRKTLLPEGTEVAVLLRARSELFVRPHLLTDETGVALNEQDKTYSATYVLKESTKIEVTFMGYQLFSADVGVVKDTSPTIKIKQPVKQTDQNALDIAYVFKDDYGLSSMDLIVDRKGTESRYPIFNFSKSKEGEAGFVKDILEHPYAGLSVDLSLEVTDAFGHKVISKSEPYILPKPRLEHPVAQALVDIRKELFLGQKHWHELAYQLEPFIRQPQLYKEDKFAFMTIAMAQHLLLMDERSKEMRVGNHLWEAAMRIEKGPLGQLLERAKERLEYVQQDIHQQRSYSDTKPNYIAFEQALMDLLGAVAFHGDSLWGRQAGALRRDDFLRLLAKLHQELVGANLKAALGTADKLARLLGMINPSNSDKANELYEALKKMLEQFMSAEQDLASLQEKAFKDGKPQALTEQDLQKIAELIKQLQQLKQQMEGAPEVQQMLERAMQALGQAAELSKQGKHGQAQQFLQEAMKGLMQGRQGFLEHLRKQMGQSGMEGMKRDPSGNFVGEDEVVVGDESPAELSKKIRDQLFEKSADQERPQAEKDYFKRLLERF